MHLHIHMHACVGARAHTHTHTHTHTHEEGRDKERGIEREGVWWDRKKQWTRLLAFGHLDSNLLLDGCGVGGGLAAEHAHHITNLDLRFGGLQQALSNELLLLLLPLQAALRPQLLALLQNRTSGISTR
jgi:hypothetical protein